MHLISAPVFEKYEARFKKKTTFNLESDHWFYQLSFTLSSVDFSLMINSSSLVYIRWKYFQCEIITNIIS